MDLALGLIRMDGGTQPRAEVDHFTVNEYANAMQEGDRFPAVIVFHDGSNYWLADGFHRVKAAEKIEALDIPADVKQGTREDAQWFSYGVNRTHGLQRTNEDKQRAVKSALKHSLGSKKSDREIGQHCGVDHVTVGGWRRKLEATGEIHQSDKRIGADGRTINTANIGKAKGEKPLPDDAFVPPPDVAVALAEAENEDALCAQVQATVQGVFDSSGLTDENGGIPPERGAELLSRLQSPPPVAAIVPVGGDIRRSKPSADQLAEERRYRRMEAAGELDLTDGDNARHLVEIICELAEAPITPDQFRRSLLVTDLEFTRQNLPAALATLEGIGRVVA